MMKLKNILSSDMLKRNEGKNAVEIISGSN